MAEQLTVKESDYWETPNELVCGILQYLKYCNLINWQTLEIELDVCANEQNSKGLTFISEEENALIQDWNEKQVWCNPPYSRGFVDLFVGKAIQQVSENGCDVVMLLNVDTGTKYFETIINNAKAVIFITGGRINFLNPNTRRPVNTGRKPSMIALFSPTKTEKMAYTYYVNRDDLLNVGSQTLKDK